MHKECHELLSHEGFYNEDDYGTDDDFFHNAIFDYVNEHHLSDNGEDLTKAGMAITFT